MTDFYEIIRQWPLLSGIQVVTALGLLTVMLVPENRPGLIKKLAAVFSGVDLLICILIFLAYDQEAGGFQFVEKHLWVKALGIHYFNAVDGINLPMILLTGIVLFTGCLTMWELENRVKEFFAFSFLLVLGVFGVFMSMDLFFLFVYYDIALFPMYPLIAIWGSTRKEYGAMKLTLYLLAGSALILPGIILLYVKSGLWTFDIIALSGAEFTPYIQSIGFLLFFFGFGILAGVWPFHTWSPVGHVAAPTSVSMIHAGVLMKLGAYGVLRVGAFLCPEGWVQWADLMAVLAVIGILYGAFVGLAQTDLKYVIGYSSVSHMGIVGLGLSTVTVSGMNGAVFQMFAHGIMTALLFSSVGYIYDKTHTKTTFELGGMSRNMPVISGFFILAALAGVGVPCLASFWAELLVFISAVKVYPVRGILAISGLLISALFMLRVVMKTYYGPANEKYAGLSDVTAWLATPRVILAGVIVFFGLFPWLMLNLIQTATVSFPKVMGF
ncbi:MAG: NADH-quinone oxidoreductase subunit M [Deltaproteobacteria bacterium]|nr:NADH-quinone oxidoreductase subunit M [Deltaproteobacteria bacterium]